MRLLIVEDSQTLAESLRATLEQDGHACDHAADGEQAIAFLAGHDYDLLVLDWMLPGLDGVSVCRQLRAKSDVSILMLTARGELEDRVAGLDAGADDYLVKPFRFQELLARVNAMLRRRNLQARKRLSVGELALDRETREVWRNDQPVALTPREFGLLELMMSHPRQVFTREQMLNRVWGYSWTGDANVVEVHISSLREKVGDAERQLIRTVRGVGYTLRG